MKQEIISELDQLESDIQNLKFEISKLKVDFVKNKIIETISKELSDRWFDSICPLLKKATFDEELVKKYNSLFEQLLEVTSKNSRKSTLVKIVQELSVNFKKELTHKIRITQLKIIAGLNIRPYIEGLENEDEKKYLEEASICAENNCIRASIVLGWCATINRIHEKIQTIGFERFNTATKEMKTITAGRFKNFNKEKNIGSLSELREVFDTDLLWVIEYLGLIDINQHERLRHCFVMRNNSGHPGDAPITGENLYSFYSDITHIVLKNLKFKKS